MSKLHIHLTTLTFDEAGSGEKSEFSYIGHYEESSTECRLRWSREEEGVTTKTIISFDRARMTEVCMKESGGGEAAMVFSTERESESLYRVPGAGAFSLTIRTRRVENSLSATGGRLVLDYEALLGGTRQRILLTLVAE